MPKQPKPKAKPVPLSELVERAHRIPPFRLRSTNLPQAALDKLEAWSSNHARNTPRRRAVGSG